MGKRRHEFKVENLLRMLLYMLAHRPDEFGLVPDEAGYVSFKALLQACHEEPGWAYVRRSHINEVLMGKDRNVFEADETRIRAKERKWHLDLKTPVTDVPALLYTAVRKKAHPVVMEKGLKAPAGHYLVLSADKNMAARTGKRRDQHPVILEIKVETGKANRPLFYAFGDIFLGLEIQADMISGPMVPKETAEQRREPEPKKERPKPKPEDFMPGTFRLDISRDPDRSRRGRGKKPKGWKEAARKERRRNRDI